MTHALIRTYETTEHKCWRARFDGESAKRLGMARDANPHEPGQCFKAWLEGWDSIPRWRRTDYREPIRELGRSPPPRPCPEQNPRRPHE